jgi:hypothetical protein
MAGEYRLTGEAFSIYARGIRIEEVKLDLRNLGDALLVALWRFFDRK